MRDEQDYQTSIDTLIKNLFKPTAASDKGSCPLKSLEFAIYPVRYAIAENPFLETLHSNTELTLTDWDKLTNKKTKHSLPPKDPIFGELPELNSRDYTLRQLRQGWLYVWTAEDEWAEYQITPPTTVGQLTTFCKTDIYAKQDQRLAMGKPEYALYFKRNQRVYLSYSPVQWSQRMFEWVKQTGAQSKMRCIKLPEFAANLQAPHADFIDNIDKKVADIYQGKADTSFCSTLVTNITTQATEDGFKREQTSNIPKAELIAKLKDPDSALYVALDDHLGIIGDLLLNVSYPTSAIEIYETVNQRKTNIGNIILAMCGSSLEDFVPEQISRVPGQKYLYLKDVCNDLLTPQAAVLQAEREHPGLRGTEITYAYALEAKTAKTLFLTKWPNQLPKQKVSHTNKATATQTETTWQQMVAAWSASKTIRRNLYLDQLLEHLAEREKQLTTYNKYVELTINDLLVWLNRLPLEAKDLLHDSDLLSQSTALMALANNISDLIQQHPIGQQWIKNQLTKPVTLFGLTAFNFNQDIYKFFLEIGKRIAQTHKVNNNDGLGDGKIAINKNLAYVGFLNLNDYLSAITSDQIIHSKYYQTLSAPAKAAYNAFNKIVMGPAKELYQGFFYRNLFTISTMPAANIAAYGVIQNITSSTNHQTIVNIALNGKHLKWQQAMLDQFKYRAQEVASLNNAIADRNQPRNTKSQRQQYSENIAYLEQRVANRDINIHQLEEQMPIPVIVTERTDRVSLGTEEFLYLKSGVKDLISQQQIRATDPLLYKKQLTNFINQYKGSALPLGMALWNIYRAAQIMETTANKTALEFKDIINNISYLGYMGNSVMALWIAPAWENFSKTQLELTYRLKQINKTLLDSQKLPETYLLRDMSLQELKKYNKMFIKEGRAITTIELEYIARNMLLKVGLMNSLLAIAAFGEAYTVSQDFWEASNNLEGVGQGIKFISLIVTGGLASVWLGNMLGFSLTIGAAMGPAVVIGMLAAGLVYIAAELWISYFKREGLALWLDHSIWGDNPKWGTDNSEQHQLEELTSLHKVLHYPTVNIKQTKLIKSTLFSDGPVSETTGYWLQFCFPPELAFSKVGINLLLVKDFWGTHNPAYEPNAVAYFKRVGQYGFWSDPAIEADQLLSSNPLIGTNTTLANIDYKQQHYDRYIYNIWLPFDSIQQTTNCLNIEIIYPYQLAQQINLMDLITLKNSQQHTYSYLFETELFALQSTLGSGNPETVTMAIEQVAENKENKTFIKNPHYKPQIQSFTLTVGVPDGASH